MDTKADQATTEELGNKRYGKLVRLFREGYLSVAVYKNVYERKTFYDIVIYRKIKSATNGGFDYKRGANLKPSDIPQLQMLLTEVQEYLASTDL